MRSNYQSDYIIKIPYTEDDLGLNSNLVNIDDIFISKLSNIKNIKNIYFQYSVIESNKYMFLIKDENITYTGKKLLNLSCPTKPLGLTTDDNYIFTGLSGYGNKELELSKKYIIEGTININKMENEPPVILPKYVKWLENITIPYTKLQVGDKITLMEIDNDEEIINRKVFTIGAFVETPFRQVNGPSSGFVGIMHKNQLKKFIGDKMVLKELYVDTKKINYPMDIINLCREYEYQLEFYKNNNTENNEIKSFKLKSYMFSVYASFGIIITIVFVILFNIIFSSLIIRKKEFVILFCIGMDKTQILLSYLAEILISGIIGSVLGSCVGICLILFSDMRSEILPYYMLIPWRHIWAGVFSIVFISIISVLLCVCIVSRKFSIMDLKEDY